MRIRDFLLLIIAFVGAVWMYQIKHDAENSAQRITELKEEIQKEEKKIILYQADWAVLTSPNHLSQHLEDLELNLKLKSPETSQFVTLQTLPPKIKVQEDTLENILGIEGENYE